MANYIDFEYTGKKADPTSIIVWEQNYETRKVEEKEYNIADYLYFYIDALDEKQIIPDLTSQRGTKVQRIKTDTFKEFKSGDTAKMYRNMGVNTYESDIEPIQKVMLDNYGMDNQRAAEWNLALYDIETDVLSTQTFMDMRENANREINAISVWYAKPNKYYNFTLVPPMLRDEWDYDKVEKRGNFEIIYFDNEADMLEAFFDMNKFYDTIALGAWNGDFFDTGYIFNRCKQIWGEKGAAIRMGRFNKVRKTKIMLGDKEELIIRPIGMIWYDCLEAYKKNGPELESFALQAVVEEELGTSKVDFEGSFETLYHSTPANRKRFNELTPPKQRKKLVNQSLEIGNQIIEEMELYSWAEQQSDVKDVDETEKETRIQMKITEKLEQQFKTAEFKETLGDLIDDVERFICYKKMLDTYRLFLDYSNQDSQLLKNLEDKLDKFNTLMMLAQYNVSGFQDVFATLKQVEQGITNFAHLYNKKVVIDREYDKTKQIYNKYVDPKLMKIRIDNDYKITSEDSADVKRMKVLTSQPKIPGAHVLLPQIGLISFDDELTPKLAKEFKALKAELAEIDKQLAQLEDD